MQEKIPLKTISMEALLVAEKSQSACRNYLLARSDLEKLEQDIRDALTGLGMCTAMLAMGTESPAFLESPEGALYSRVGLSMNVPAPTGEVQEIAEQLQALKAEFALAAEALISAHRQRMQYSFVYNGILYNAPGFLYAAFSKQRDIVKQLESFVEYGVEIEPDELVPEKSMFGSWYPTFTSQDKDLNGSLEELAMLHARFFTTVQKLINDDEDMRPVHFATLERTMDQLDHVILTPVLYSEKKIAETEALQQAAIQDLTATFAKISDTSSATQGNCGC